MTPQKPMPLANVVAKVRNINETAKLFGNFLLFNNFIAWFDESSGTGSSTLKSEPMYLSP